MTTTTALPEYILAVAGEMSDSVAILDGAVTLTFAELDLRAHLLCGKLRQLGVGPEVVTALDVRGTADRIVAALAVWKAGGAFFVVDPAWPRAFAAKAVDAAKALVVVTDSELECRARFILPFGPEPSACAYVDAAYSTAFYAGPVTKPDQLACVAFGTDPEGRAELHPITHGTLLNLCFPGRLSAAVTDLHASLTLSPAWGDLASGRIHRPGETPHKALAAVASFSGASVVPTESAPATPPIPQFVPSTATSLRLLGQKVQPGTIWMGQPGKSTGARWKVPSR